MQPEKKIRVTFRLSEKEIAKVRQMLGLVNGVKLAHAIRAFVLKPRAMKFNPIKIDSLDVGEVINILRLGQLGIKEQKLTMNEVYVLMGEASEILAKRIK